MQPNPTLEFWLVIAAGVLVFADAIRSAWVAFRRPDVEKQAASFRKTVRAAQLTIADETNYKVQDLGGSVFVIAGRRWLRWNKHLKRVSRVRFSDYPAESKVDWVKGKGVIGEVWETGSLAYENLLPICLTWGRSRRHTEDEFRLLPETQRQNFSFHEFGIVASKYAEVIAVPIVRPDGRLIGVFAMDVVFSEHRPDDEGHLDTENVRRIMTETAGILRGELS